MVKAGDTLGGISQQLGVPADDLIALNGLADPNAIVEGQVLKLPPPAATGAALASARPGAAEYVVRPGDTLSGIARTLRTTVRALIELNGLADPNRLIAGQRLKVPEGSPRPSPSPQAAAEPTAEGAPLLDRLASRHGVDPALVKALAWVASGGRPLAPTDVNALGLLQVSPATFEHVAQTLLKRNLDRASVEDNAEAGVAYLAAMLRWAGEGGEARALAGFIQGPGSVQAEGVRPATEQQVKAILALRTRLGGRAGASEAAPRLAPSTAAGGLAERVVMAARAAAGPGGRIGVAGRDLVGGQRIAIAANQPFPAASVGKLWILAEVYRQHHAGIRPLTDATRADLQRMVLNSDNDAANRLMELVGVRSINGTLAALGLAGTHLANHFGATRPAGGQINTTTPADMLRFMELLAADEIVSPNVSHEIRALLFQAGDGSKLRSGLPPEARLAHKSGWFDGVANDVGLVYHGQSVYALAVFTEGIADPAAANETIAAVARAVHAAWGPRWTRPASSLEGASSTIPATP